eukprot:3541465-Prorocentrum_lima.AAC.1
MIAEDGAPKKAVSCPSSVLQVQGAVGVGGHVNSGHICGVDHSLLATKSGITEPTASPCGSGD